MLILVEGPDGVGKSTLVEKLRRYGEKHWLKTQVLHAGPPRRHPLDEWVEPLLTYRPTHFQWDADVVICDRWHLGELVYPTVLDRPTQLDANVFRYVEMFLQSRGAVVVHVTDDADGLARVLRERGDDLVRPEQADLMVNLFWHAVDATHLPVLTLEARTSSEDTVAAVVGFALHHEKEAAHLAKYVTYVGPKRPRHLLVGDVRGGDPATHGEKTAFLPYPNSCGLYLLRAVRSATDLAGVGIINANDVDDVAEAWRNLGQPKVAALGRLAEAELTKKHVTIDTYAPHPQWWKRFRHADYAAYGKQITEGWKL